MHFDWMTEHCKCSSVDSLGLYSFVSKHELTVVVLVVVTVQLYSRLHKCASVGVLTGASEQLQQTEHAAVVWGRVLVTVSAIRACVLRDLNFFACILSQT